MHGGEEEGTKFNYLQYSNVYKSSDAFTVYVFIFTVLLALEPGNEAIGRRRVNNVVVFRTSMREGREPCSQVFSGSDCS